MRGSDALGAGFMLVLATAFGAGAGVLLGSLADVRVLGGLAGGIVGTAYGFRLVWMRFVRPAIERSERTDYTGISPLEDDDDDDW